MIAGLEPGGVFLGLQGFSPTGWQAPRLVNVANPSTGVGGRLAMTSSCQEENSGSAGENTVVITSPFSSSDV